LRGVAAEYMPFFPEQRQRERWLVLRARRGASQAPFDKLLILGSAVNPPTRAGMAELLIWLRSRPPAPRLAVKVIGYGTEVFRDFQTDQLAILGALSDANLQDQLVGARAAILHQPAAAGALIRVSEMLLAGIPVFANAIAARSTSQYDGVATYESFAELGAMLDSGGLEVPPVPEPPTAFERSFLETISAWNQL
jgi:hypothetical protein